VQEYLGSKGKIDVVMTREADRDASMEERVRSAVKSRAELFVCLHVNAGFAKDTSGFEVYFPGFKTPTKTSDDSGEIVKDMISTRSLNESVRFSQLLRRQMESSSLEGTGACVRPRLGSDASGGSGRRPRDGIRHQRTG